MSSFFNLDSGFFSFMSKVCDVIIISLIWMVLCIPIITIGPATTALYYTSVKVLRGERGYLIKEFFRSFKLNFKRATIISIILIAIAALLSVDLYAAQHLNLFNETTNSIFYGIYLSFTAFILSITIYIFPLLARFDMTVKQLFKSAAIMAIRHLPSTVCMLALLIASAIGIGFFVLAAAFLPAVTALLHSLFLEKIFKIYMPASEEAKEAEVSDEELAQLEETEVSTTEKQGLDESTTESISENIEG